MNVIRAGFSYIALSWVNALCIEIESDDNIACHIVRFAGERDVPLLFSLSLLLLFRLQNQMHKQFEFFRQMAR